MHEDPEEVGGGGGEGAGGAHAVHDGPQGPARTQPDGQPGEMQQYSI